MNKVILIASLAAAGIAALCGKVAYDRRNVDHIATTRIVPDKNQI